MKNLKVYQDSDDSKTVLLAEWKEENEEVGIERVCLASKPHFSPKAITLYDLQQTTTTLLQVISKQDKRIAELEKIIYYNYEEKHDE